MLPKKIWNFFYDKNLMFNSFVNHFMAANGVTYLLSKHYVKLASMCDVITLWHSHAVKMFNLSRFK